MKRKAIAWLLTFCMVLTMIPTLAFAAEEEQAPALPTATVKDIENEKLTFAMNFKANDVTEKQLAYYGNWYADFELTVNKDVTFNANGGADGYLSGQYDEWSPNWVNVPFENVKLNAGDTLKIMAYAAEQMGEPGLKYTYGEVYETVKDFDCGVFFEEEFLAANPDLKVTLELKMYNPADETESYVIGKTYTFPKAAPKLPTATVTDAENDKLTFAMNFKADQATDEQLAYYGDWYADFELTVNKAVTFNANGGADGYLSGQYDEAGAGWINVPFNDMKLGKNQTIKIMATAAELLGEPGLKYTYREIHDVVKEFNCGIFFEEAFLEANPDLEVTLELKMYNPADESESYVIGDTYTFPKMPELPTATVKGIENDNLTFAMNFKADEATESQQAYYGNWYADFELTVNEDVTFNANGGADGYLSGSYDEWNNGNWVNVPFEDVKLKAYDKLKIMEYAAEQLGKPGLKYTYKEIYETVKDFDCGVFFEPEFIEAHPNLEVRLKLKIYNPENQSENYLIGDTYVFNLKDIVAMNTATGKVYSNLQVGLNEAKEGQTVKMLKDIGTAGTTVINGTLDLNGYTLTTDYMAAFGDIVDLSEDNTGVLVVPEKRIFLQTDNEQLPIKNGVGYQFFEVTRIDNARVSDICFAFVPVIEPASIELIKAGKSNSGVTMNVQVKWTKPDGARVQNFEYDDSLVNDVAGSWNETELKYKRMYKLTLNTTEGIEGYTYNALVKSDTGVEIATPAL